MDLPFRSSGAVDEPAGADATPRRDRQPVVLGLLAAVVLAAGGFLLLDGGSEPSDVALATPPAPVATAASTPPASASPAADAPVAELRAGRDPFRALRTEVAAVAPVAAGGGPDAGDTPAPVGAPAQGAPLAVPPPGASSATRPAAPARALRTLLLLAVEGDGARRTAVLTVDGTRVRAAVGDSFGPAGQLLLLSLQQEPDGVAWTAVVQTAGSEPFDLVTGVPASLP